MPTRPAIDAVLTMCPPASCARRSGRNASTPCTTPQKLTDMVYCQSAWVASATSPKVATPALLQTMCTPPKRSAAAAASPLTLSRRVTSVGMVRTSVRRRGRVAATRSIASASTSARTMRAPRAANAAAIAAPIPPPPPVITATRPRNSSMGGLPSVRDARYRLQGELRRVEGLLDELVTWSAADRGTVRLVVDTDDDARQHRGERPVGGLGEGVAAHRVVEVLAGAVGHDLPVDAVHLAVEVHDDLAEVVVGVGGDALDDPGRAGHEHQAGGDEPGHAGAGLVLEARGKGGGVDRPARRRDLTLRERVGLGDHGREDLGLAHEPPPVGLDLASVTIDVIGEDVHAADGLGARRRADVPRATRLRHEGPHVVRLVPVEVADGKGRHPLDVGRLERQRGRLGDHTLRVVDGAAVTADVGGGLDAGADRAVGALLVEARQVEARTAAASHQARRGEVPGDLTAGLGVVARDRREGVAEVEVRHLAGRFLTEPAARGVEIVLAFVGGARCPERVAVVVVETRRIGR